MKLEQQLLPHKDLAPLYDKAIWVYVYQTFKQDEADRAAERIAIRFGVTSWPQLLLAEPGKLTTINGTGRTVASFRRAFGAVKLEKLDTEPSALATMALAQAELTAQELYVKRSVEQATQVLTGSAKEQSDDIVVRTRAAQVLVEKKPAVLVEHAATLLKTPSDAFRYLVCQTLGKAGDARAAPHLEALVKDPQPSRNPNVVRIRAVQALATCGRPESVAVVAPHATTGVYFNGLTGIAIDTLAALAKRYPEARPEVERLLRTAYPKPPNADSTSKHGMRMHRAARGLARRIHKAVGDPRTFPVTYDEAARTLLMSTPEQGK